MRFFSAYEINVFLLFAVLVGDLLPDFRIDLGFSTFGSSFGSSFVPSALSLIMSSMFGILHGGTQSYCYRIREDFGLYLLSTDILL